MSEEVNAIDISCFDDIIGLSATNCSCFPDNSYSISKSNLFLDQLEGLNLNSLSGMADCDKGELFEIMARARKNGIMRYISDVNAQLGLKYILKRQPFTGKIGQATFKNSLTGTNTYNYLRMYCADVVSGKMILKGIGTCFEATGTITVWMYDNENTLLHTFTLNTQAGKHIENTFATALEFDMHGNYVDNKDYYFVYQYNPLNKPKDIKMACGCDGFHPIFDVAKPYCFNTQSNKKYGWSCWVMPVSGGTDTLDFMCDSCYNARSSSLYTNGLTFDIEFSCNVNEVLCQDSFDFVTNPVALATAHAIRYYAGIDLVLGLLGSNNINRFTMSNGEFYQALYVEFQKKYDKLIEWIVKQVDIKANDCLECKNVFGLVKGGIMV